MPMHLAMHLPQKPPARCRYAVARRIALSSGLALSFGSTGPGILAARLLAARLLESVLATESEDSGIDFIVLSESTCGLVCCACE
jgi:hypothetical protein